MTKTRIYAVIGLLILIFLTSCRSGNLFSSQITEPAQTNTASVENSTTAEESTNVEPTKEEETAKTESPELADVTEVATYDVKNACKADSLGVVRMFDADGKKKVFRPFCDGQSVVTFSCVDGIARPTSKQCPNGCWTSPTKGVGECNPNVPPPRTPGRLPKY